MLLLQQFMLTSFSRDPEFYEFTRSLRGYGATFNNKSDILLIDPNLISLNILINPTAPNLSLDEQKYPYSWFAMGG